MKIFRMMIVSVMCVMLLALAACGNDGEEAQVEPPSEIDQILQAIEEGEDIELTPVPPEIHERYLDPDHPEFPFYIPETVGVFELSEAERAYYDEYILTGDLSALEGIEPVSVLRVWIQAGIDGNLEHEFNLFHPDTLDGETLEAYLESNSPEFAGSPAIRQRWANVFFSHLEDGEFVVDADGSRGTLIFYTETEERISLSVRQNEAGIWLVERGFF
ncbi:MAG: hypothetical protein FWE20_09555 [Defluviitaleaceae bacterium]|nr:hypothetical protein [Defluviitaleaceae bacterium]